MFLDEHMQLFFVGFLIKCDPILVGIASFQKQIYQIVSAADEISSQHKILSNTWYWHRFPNHSGTGIVLLCMCDAFLFLMN